MKERFLRALPVAGLASLALSGCGYLSGESSAVNNKYQQARTHLAAFLHTHHAIINQSIIGDQTGEDVEYDGNTWNFRSSKYDSLKGYQWTEGWQSHTNAHNPVLYTENMGGQLFKAKLTKIKQGHWGFSIFNEKPITSPSTVQRLEAIAHIAEEQATR